MRPHSSRGCRRGGVDSGRRGGGGDMSWLAVVGVMEEEERKLVIVVARVQEVVNAADSNNIAAVSITEKDTSLYQGSASIPFVNLVFTSLNTRFWHCHHLTSFLTSL